MRRSALARWVMAVWVALAALVLTVGAGIPLATPAFADESAFIYDNSPDDASDRIAGRMALGIFTLALATASTLDKERSLI